MARLKSSEECLLFGLLGQLASLISILGLLSMMRGWAFPSPQVGPTWHYSVFEAYPFHGNYGLRVLQQINQLFIIEIYKMKKLNLLKNKIFFFFLKRKHDI